MIHFDRPLISREQIRRRQDVFADGPREREIARLRALNRLADLLNRTTDLQIILDVTLQTLVEVMGLQTAWIFLSTETGLTRYIARPRRTTSRCALHAACHPASCRTTITNCASRPTATARPSYEKGCSRAPSPSSNALGFRMPLTKTTTCAACSFMPPSLSSCRAGRRIIPSGMRLIVSISGNREERALADEQEYAAVLKERFGIVL